MTYEDNPFEDAVIAREWINSIENEKGMIREKELLPLLKEWIDTIKPEVVVDIGMGQGGCADTVQWDRNVWYIGVDPSIHLVKRANELYWSFHRDFLIGNAYALPLEDESADAAISINVWFHLKDIDTATKELSRVLERNGHFMICTANPDAYASWRSRFEDGAKEDEEKIDGKVYVPINPLSRNIIYKHSMEKILSTLKDNGLEIEKVITNGVFDDRNGFNIPLFINLFGYKL